MSHFHKCLRKKKILHMTLSPSSRDNFCVNLNGSRMPRYLVKHFFQGVSVKEISIWIKKLSESRLPSPVCVGFIQSFEHLNRTKKYQKGGFNLSLLTGWAETFIFFYSQHFGFSTFRICLESTPSVLWLSGFRTTLQHYSVSSLQRANCEAP